ncbi:hypothetical protein PF005_g19022 [Phytophthora fragariae]|uniref:Uncharacterized protein n=1 Tax=Phytophthora fragariae TaxID=53985 RepID=A0A6A3WUH7_9STRA|nr:hypothetical protein PF005_g19022 [Phytophthora fragariae]
MTEEHDLHEKNSLEVSNNREPEQFPQGDQEMIIQDDGRSDGDVEMATAAEQSRIAVEYATATKLTKQKQIQERVKQKTDVRGRSPTKRQGRTLQERKKAQEEARKKSKDTQDRMEEEGCQQGAVKASNKTANEREDGFAGTTRKASLSPKRKAEDLGTGHDGDDEDEQGDPGRQGAVLSTRGRSVSPKRRSTNAARSGDKVITQSFIHQYMKATTIKSADNGEVRTGSGVDRESRAPTPTKSAPINYHSNQEHEHKSGPMQEEGVEGDTDPWDPEQTTREGNATGSSKPEVDRKSNMTGTLEVKNTSVVMVKEDAALSNRGYEELSLNGKSDEASKSAVVDTSDLDSMVAGVAQTQ